MRVVSTTQRLAKVPATRHTKPATTRGKILSGGIGALIGIVLGAWSATAWPTAQWVADPVRVVAPPGSVVSVTTTVAAAPEPTRLKAATTAKVAPPVTRTVTPTPAPSSAPQPASAVPSSAPPSPTPTSPPPILPSIVPA